MTDPPLPAEIGRYRVLDLLGRGAMGIVYKAYDPSIGRNVAIKVVRIDAADPQERAEAVNRFRLEVQAAGRCSHASIVAVYDFLDQDGDPAIVMELVEGSSLQAHLRAPARRAALPIPGVMLPLLDALGYAHGQGIIHRDIKPANILIATSGQVKIADFGIARLAGLATTMSGAMTGVTSGVLLGTPSYMAPEQLKEAPVDGRADLFAVGAILYEILCGRPPFAGRTVMETLARLASADMADFAPVIAAGGPAYAQILRRALAKDPAHRFQSADDFAAALEGISTADAMATVVMPPRLAPPPTPVWDPALLQRVEQQFARFVGPMARVIVAQAVQEAEDTQALYANLARSLPNAADRSLFLRAVGGGRVEPSVGGRSDASLGSKRAVETLGSRGGAGTFGPRAGGGALGPSSGTSGGIGTLGPRQPAPSKTLSGPMTVSTEAAAAAQAALVQYVGPIAKVLVRDAAIRATTGREFIDLLCRHVEKPEELAALRRRLRAEVEPKLL